LSMLRPVFKAAPAIAYLKNPTINVLYLMGTMVTFR
jgi:hypothetical protein